MKEKVYDFLPLHHIKRLYCIMLCVCAIILLTTLLVQIVVILNLRRLESSITTEI